MRLRGGLTSCAALMLAVVSAVGPAVVPARVASAAPRSGFGPPVTVLRSSCKDLAGPGRWADAAAGTGGRVHGFADFGPGPCDGRIWYFSGRDRSWRRIWTPYTGRVLAVAWDTTGTYLLYANRTGVWVTKRTTAGVFTRGHRLSRAAGVSEGDLLVSRGSWWAVWAEDAPGDPGTAIFQAKTYGRDVGKRGVEGPHSDVLLHTPTLAWRADGAAVLAFAGESPPLFDWELPNHWASLRTSRDGRWTELPSPRFHMSSPVLDLALHGRTIFVAYPFCCSGVLVASTESGTWGRAEVQGIAAGRGVFFGDGASRPRLAVAPGRLLVAGLDSERGRIALAQRRGRWSVTSLTPAADVKALVFAGGRPVILATGRATHRLYALTGSR
jgi:hypothetical protein